MEEVLVDVKKRQRENVSEKRLSKLNKNFHSSLASIPPSSRCHRRVHSWTNSCKPAKIQEVLVTQKQLDYVNASSVFPPSQRLRPDLWGLVRCALNPATRERWHVDPSKSRFALKALTGAISLSPNSLDTRTDTMQKPNLLLMTLVTAERFLLVTNVQANVGILQYSDPCYEAFAIQSPGVDLVREYALFLSTPEQRTALNT